MARSLSPLAARSIGPPPLNDCCDNHRVDGRQMGVLTITSGEVNSKVHRVDSDALPWVLEQILAIED